MFHCKSDMIMVNHRTKWKCFWSYINDIYASKSSINNYVCVEFEDYFTL